MIYTTLPRIREHGPCAPGWRKLLSHLGKTQADDAPLSYVTILESNGLDDALWCCRAEPQHARDWQLFAVRCARSVQHLMVDPRSIAALDFAERHADGLASDAARAAARAAAWAAARAAAWDSASAADRDSAWDSAWAAMTEDFRRVVTEGGAA